MTDYQVVITRVGQSPVLDDRLTGGGGGSGAAPEVEYHVVNYYDSSISTDWGLAINAAIADCLGPTNPATTTRLATGRIVLPPGNLPVRTQPLIKSAIGVHMEGAGPYMTSIQPDGIASGLELWGCAYSHFNDFSIRGSGTVTNGIWSHTDTGAFRTASSVSFRDVHIMELDFVNGFRIGGDNNSLQCDKHSFYDCHIQGQYTPGVLAPWTNGYLFGSGGAGNNLVHNIYNLLASQVAYAINIQGVDINVWGGSCENNEIVILDNSGPVSAIYIGGLRSEGAKQLYASLSGVTWNRRVHLDSVDFYCNALATAKWIQLGSGGTYVLTNLAAQANNPGSFTPIIDTVGNAKTTIMAHGLSICNGDVSSINAWMPSTGSNVSVIATGVSQTDTTGAIISMKPFQCRLADVQTVTGSRSGNAALASTLTALAGRGLLIDGSSA